MFGVKGSITARLLGVLGKDDPAWTPPRGTHSIPTRKPDSTWSPTGRRPGRKAAR